MTGPQLIAWMLLVVAVVSALGALFVQKQKLDVAAIHASADADAEKSLRAQLAASATAQHSLEAKVQSLETENTRLKAKVASVASSHIAAPSDSPKKKSSARKHHKRH